MSKTAPRREPPDLITEEEAGPIVGLTSKTLANKRSSKDPDGPPYVRISGRAIRYSRKALAAWLADRTVDPGAQAS